MSRAPYEFTFYMNRDDGWNGKVEHSSLSAPVEVKGASDRYQLFSAILKALNAAERSVLFKVPVAPGEKSLAFEPSAKVLEEAAGELVHTMQRAVEEVLGELGERAGSLRQVDRQLLGEGLTVEVMSGRDGTGQVVARVIATYDEKAKAYSFRRVIL
jgi:hypothetical protein